MSKHTPGPWVDAPRSYDGELTGWINCANGVPVVEYEGCGSHEACWPNPADKALVLAAPDLLEALKLCAVLVHDGNRQGDAAIEAARAAIAKAEGV